MVFNVTLVLCGTTQTCAKFRATPDAYARDVVVNGRKRSDISYIPLPYKDLFLAVSYEETEVSRVSLCRSLTIHLTLFVLYSSLCSSVRSLAVSRQLFYVSRASYTTPLQHLPSFLMGSSLSSLCFSNFPRLLWPDSLAHFLIKVGPGGQHQRTSLRAFVQSKCPSLFAPCRPAWWLFK